MRLARAARVDAHVEVLVADERFRQAALVAEANHCDVAVVLTERDETLQAARIARALVIQQARQSK